MHLYVQGVDLSEINTHHPCPRNDALNDRRKRTKNGPNRTAVPVCFGVEQDEGGQGKREAVGGGGRQAQAAEKNMAESTKEVMRK